MGTPDSTDDIRGGMGIDGLMNLYKFVQQGGTLITEGSTSTLFPEYQPDAGRHGREPAGALRARHDRSRRDHGHEESARVRHHRQGTAGVLQPGTDADVGGGRGGAGGGGRGANMYAQNTQPMALENQVPVSSISIGGAAPRGRGACRAAADAVDVAVADAADAAAQVRRRPMPPAVAAAEDSAGAVAQPLDPATQPRVVMRFPADTTQMLLSGALAGMEALSSRVQLVDSPVGKGHVVSFAIRPFWRWQTQGTYFLGFNAIMNWNHLDAGRAAAPTP